MSYFAGVIRKYWRPHLDAYRDDKTAQKDPTFFRPTGTQVYVGVQGSGKTISAVKHLIDIKKLYPQCIVVSNLQLTTLKPREITDKQSLISDLEILTERGLQNEYYFIFKTMDELAIALTSINNDKKGVIYLIDEIHTYFNALESKNIPMYVFTEISQQRKQRKLIIGTSQLFLRMAKPFREQCDNIVVCNTKFGIFTTQTAYDGMTIDQDYDGKLSGSVKKKGFFFHNREIRAAYDTYQKVVSGSEQYDANRPLVIQQKTNKLFGKKATVLAQKS